MDIGIYISFQISILFVCLFHISQVWNCWVIFLFVVFWETSIVFCSRCTNLHSHQQCRRVPFSQHPLQHLSLAHITSITVLESFPGGTSGKEKWEWKLRPTLCNPTDSTVHGILQAQLLEWVAFPFSRGSYQPRDRTQVSHITGGLFTSWATREAQQ